MSQNDETFVTDEVEAVLTRGPEPKPAKKAAAKKAAAPPEYAGPAWPYADDHYLYEPVTSRRGHHDARNVAAIQQALDLPVTGVWNVETSNAVAEFQKARGGSASGVVDRETWEAILG